MPAVRRWIMGFATLGVRLHLIIQEGFIALDAFITRWIYVADVFGFRQALHCVLASYVAIYAPGRIRRWRRWKRRRRCHWRLFTVQAILVGVDTKQEEEQRRG